MNPDFAQARVMAAVEMVFRAQRSRRQIEKLVRQTAAAVALSEDLLARIGPVERFVVIRRESAAAPAPDRPSP